MLSRWSTCSIQPEFRFMKCHYVNPIWSHVNGSSTSSSNGGGWVELPPPKKKRKLTNIPWKFPWLEDDMSFWNGPFLGDILIFWGANCYSSGIHLLPQTEGFLKLLHPRSLRQQKASEKLWLGDKPVLLGRLTFQGLSCIVAGSVPFRFTDVLLKFPCMFPNSCTMVCHKRLLEY